eukprot:TRINITY_DN1453_c1_g2_i2.p1 TRINITY_DN1453_c1_g2~~TRINITY_DN1453_c1_g2_i2.p1  ORF type:complete len:505 (-),score=28.71 TRINITY_DN1453_c1_g2_i2:784-2298(-)
MSNRSATGGQHRATGNGGSTAAASLAASVAGAARLVGGWGKWLLAIIQRDKRARIASYVVSGIAVLLGVALVRRRLQLPSLPSKKKYDYIVIGGGSSGCVVAARLSEDPDVSVLLLEAGVPTSHNGAIGIPLASGTLQRTDVDWQFKTEPQAHTDNRIHNWPRGKVLGGSSCLNFMLYVRGAAADYDMWRDQLNCPGWGYSDVLPYYMKSENRVLSDPTKQVDKRYHGVGGPLTVTDPGFLNVVSSVFVEGAQAAGIPFNPDYNGENLLGTGFSQYTINNGRRNDTHSAFIAPLRRANLTVCTSAHVTRIIFDGKNRAIGVEYTSSRDNYVRYRRVHCAREVVLSSGAVGSPHLLLLSGVGPRADLRLHNIPLFRHIPAVGQRMQDHLFVPISWTCSQQVCLSKERMDRDQWKHLARWMLFKTGQLVSNSLESMAFIRSPICRLPYPIPDLQIHFVCAAASGDDTRLNFGYPEDTVFFSSVLRWFHPFAHPLAPKEHRHCEASY